MKELIKKNLVQYVQEYKEKNHVEHIWRNPEICFTDAKSAYVRNLRNIVSVNHAMPEDFLDDATIIIVYFLPFTDIIEKSNIGNIDASEGWASGYTETEKIIPWLNQRIIKSIEDMGYKAVEPSGISMDEEKLDSNWSHRHIAYAGGMGTFGINNMLITNSGWCGRFYSLISNLNVIPDQMLDKEYCTYKKSGKCRVCVKNCPTGALTEDSFDRFRCYEQCMKNIEQYGVDVCGKCATGIPCSLRRPC